MVTMAFADVIGYMERRLSSPDIMFEQPSTGGATMMLWTVVMWVGRVLVAVFFLMSAYNHLSNSAMMAGYAQSKGVPMARVSVIVTGLMMLAGAAPVPPRGHPTARRAFLLLFLWPPPLIISPSPPLPPPLAH